LRLRALLANRLALARGELAEEIVEAAVAAVLPVELDVAAQEPAGPLEQRALGGFDEGRVGRRKAVLFAEAFGGAQQRRGVELVLQQQARPGRGGERGGDLQLGVVAAAGPLPGVGPGVIEDVFA